jgi:hypothetical protein
MLSRVQVHFSKQVVVVAQEVVVAQAVQVLAGTETHQHQQTRQVVVVGLRLVLAVAVAQESFTSDSRFNHGRTIFCTN